MWRVEIWFSKVTFCLYSLYKLAVLIEVRCLYVTPTVVSFIVPLFKLLPDRRASLNFLREILFITMSYPTGSLNKKVLLSAGLSLSFPCGPTLLAPASNTTYDKILFATLSKFILLQTSGILRYCSLYKHCYCCSCSTMKQICKCNKKQHDK